MSVVVHRFIKYLLSPLLVIGFLFWVYQWNARVQDQSQYHEQDNFTHMTSKLSSPVKARIVLEGVRPRQAGDDFVLKLQLSTTHRLENLSYEWRLPSHIALAAADPLGELTGEMESLSPDKGLELRVRLQLLRQIEEAEPPVRYILSSRNREQLRAKYFVLTQEEKERQRRELLQRRQEYEAQK